METTISSDQARTKWRELLDSVMAGERIVIERYGKPVAAIVPYQDMAESPQTANEIREETAVYQTNEWQQMKANLIAEIKAELLMGKQSHSDWLAGWQKLQTQIAQTGGLITNLNKDEIVTLLKQTRQEIFEAEYAHLYR